MVTPAKLSPLAPVVLVLVLGASAAQAGPPYVTDDPEPVEYGHWEIYLATEHELTHAGATGTAPHLEMNYGAAPGVQLHLLAPVAYARPSGGPSHFGPGDLELGAKVRFVEEAERVPMVGVFPLVELPVGSADRGLGAGHVRLFLPLWLQKSWGPWSSYGGGGYWLNPGAGNRNYWFVGWQAQRRLSDLFALGGELYYTAPDVAGGTSSVRFNVGAVVDLSEHHHVLISAGRSVVGNTLFQGYLAYQLTL